MNVSVTIGRLARLGFSGLALLLSQQALALGTDAGTTVSNQASVAYEVSGQAQTPIDSSPAGNSVPGNGATTDFEVDRRVDFELVEDGVTDQVAPNTTGHTFDFTLTNESNGAMDFSVVLTQLGSGDAAVNGFADTDVDVSNTSINIAYVDNLAEDDNTVITVTGDVAAALANGDVANIQITVTALDPAGNSGTPIALVDGAGNADDPGVVDNIFADPDNDAIEIATDGLEIVSAALSIQKTSEVVSDPFGGTAPNAKAVPDAVIEYTVVIDNGTGSADADNVVITDNIQIPDVLFETAAYGAGQNVLVDGTPCNADDAGDTNGDGCAYDAGTGLLTIDAGTIAQSASSTITYQVRVNSL